MMDATIKKNRLPNPSAINPDTNDAMKEAASETAIIA
jgi:hypothetical protein